MRTLQLSLHPIRLNGLNSAGTGPSRIWWNLLRARLYVVPTCCLRC